MRVLFSVCFLLLLSTPAPAQSNLLLAQTFEKAKQSLKEATDALRESPEYKALEASASYRAVQSARDVLANLEKLMAEAKAVAESKSQAQSPPDGKK